MPVLFLNIRLDSKATLSYNEIEQFFSKINTHLNTTLILLLLVDF